MTQQQSIIQLFFKQGERVEVSKDAPSSVYGFGRIECEAKARPGWYYVRFPQGELELVQYTYLRSADT